MKLKRRGVAATDDLIRMHHAVQDGARNMGAALTQQNNFLKWTCDVKSMFPIKVDKASTKP